MEDEQKKPRGWFASEVKRVAARLDEIEEEFTQLKELVSEYPDVVEVFNHPLVTHFNNWEIRVRRLEQTLADYDSRARALEQMLVRAERAAQVIERGRGAG